MPAGSVMVRNYAGNTLMINAPQKRWLAVEGVRLMPLPKPNDGETKDEFIERCMGDETMKEEYPDGDQRLAVCMTQWDERQERGEKVQRPQRELRMAEIRAVEPVGDEHEMIVEGRAIVYESPTVLYEID